MSKEASDEASSCIGLGGEGYLGGGGLLEAGDPLEVVCVGGVGGRNGDFCFGGGCGTLVFRGEGAGVAGRILVGFGVAFGEAGLGSACGVDLVELVVGLEVGGLDVVFADVDLEVVDFFLEAVGVAFFQ